MSEIQQPIAPNWDDVLRDIVPDIGPEYERPLRLVPNPEQVEGSNLEQITKNLIRFSGYGIVSRAAARIRGK